MGLEGIIAKRRDAPYRSGRGGDWLKIKCIESASCAGTALAAGRVPVADVRALWKRLPPMLDKARDAAASRLALRAGKHVAAVNQARRRAWRARDRLSSARSIFAPTMSEGK